MAQQTRTTVQDALLDRLRATCEASGVPLHVEDVETLRELARRFCE